MKATKPWRAAAALLVLPSLFASAGVALADKTAVVVSTASVRGETKSCGCKKKDLGGLDRRATLIREERDRVPSTLVVDAGDFGAHQEVDPWIRTEFQWSMMGKMGYDVVTVGPNEMLQGVAPLKSLLGSDPDIQVVSANVTDKSGKLLFPESVIIERGGVKYGVTGVTSGSLYEFNKTRGIQKADEFAFEDVKTALQRVLPKLQNEAEVVVVLLHVSAGEAKRLVTDMPGMDVAIVGHNPPHSFVPERVGQTILIEPGARGQYTSILELTLTDDGKIVDYDGQAKPIGKSIAQDSALTPLVEAFEEEHGKSASAEDVGEEGDGSH